MQTKAGLRQAALAHRRALSAAEMSGRSQQVANLLFANFPLAAWQWLHIFLPLSSKNEPDTWHIIRRIWAEKLPVRLAAPVVQPDGVSLKHYELSSHTPMLANRWGIPEPESATSTEIQSATLDAVLVPLLACDETGQRVGYGGGFYDRFLAQCRPGIPLIGLNVLDEPPVSRIADVLATDVPLTACITPGRVWRFRQ